VVAFIAILVAFRLRTRRWVREAAGARLVLIVESRRSPMSRRGSRRVARSADRSSSPCLPVVVRRLAVEQLGE